MIIIEDNAALEAAVGNIQKCKIIAVDTEFDQGRAYNSKLCLVQIATTDDIFIIDPLADLDIRPLKKIFASKKILKVFCDFRQDYEILFNRHKFKLKNIADIQLLYMAVYKDRVSYQAMVKRFMNIDIDKKEQYSNWVARPISSEKLLYASLDVKYMTQIYQELNSCFDKLTYKPILSNVISRIIIAVEDKRPRWFKLATSVKFSQIALCKTVFMVREMNAKTRNKYPTLLLPEDKLLEFIQTQDFGLIRDVELSDKIKNQMSKLIQPSKRELEIIKKYRLSRGEAEMIYNIKQSVRLYAKKLQTHAELIATKSSILEDVILKKYIDIE